MLQTTCILTSSYFHCSTCIALKGLYLALHFNRPFSILHYRTIITDCLTVRYGSVFIALSWRRVFLGFGIVLSQAAYSDPSLRLTPLINSARCSAESHVWLAGSWGKFIESKIRLALPLTSLEMTWTTVWPLEGSRACYDKWAFFLLSQCVCVYTCVQKRMHAQSHIYMQTNIHTRTGRTNSCHPPCEYCITPKQLKRRCLQTWLSYLL